MTAGTILLIDDEASYLKTLVKYLEESPETYELLQALSVNQALEILQKETPDLIIVDWDMPGRNGIEFIEQLQHKEQFRDIPVIMCTGIMTSSENLHMALEAGAKDYIRKPIDQLELRARVRSMMELGSSIVKLKDSYRQMEILATTDTLTKLPNRRDILNKMAQEKSRIVRNGGVFVLALADIDKFKSINDQYGHDCGDYVLQTIAGIFDGTIRKQDHVGRWGGEEFLFVLPETTFTNAMTVAEKVRRKVEAFAFVYKGQTIDVSVTIGVCECLPEADLGECLRKADGALYQGKENGRNQTVGAESVQSKE